MARKRKQQRHEAAAVNEAIPVAEWAPSHGNPQFDWLCSAWRYLAKSIGPKCMALVIGCREHFTRIRTSESCARLLVSSRVSLGEKRFVAILEYEDRRFLVGGGANSVQLLAKLRSRTGNSQQFVDVLNDFEAKQPAIQ
ncbi:MAG TPA: flagellar biosynthetic protein FliO [Terriglobales bacterium]|nr:flagellar biosynthetic protein FliO [Terriglobales bacterium]